MSEEDKAIEFNVGARLLKFDAISGNFDGILALEVLDKSGEIMDYESSKPFFKSWSQEISEATGGKSVGNLRSMHQKQVAGKLTKIEFDDINKRVMVSGEVIDPVDREKLIKGAYTGLSIGGKYHKKWEDAVAKGIRYTAIPREASLVDNPNMYGAYLMVKDATGEHTVALVGEDNLLKTQEVPVKIEPSSDDTLLTKTTSEEKMLDKDQLESLEKAVSSSVNAAVVASLTSVKEDLVKTVDSKLLESQTATDAKIADIATGLETMKKAIEGFVSGFPVTKGVRTITKGADSSIEVEDKKEDDEDDAPVEKAVNDERVALKAMRSAILKGTPVFSE